MTTKREVVDALSRSAAAGEPVVLGTVVRVIGSSYGGVGARMLVRADGSVVGLVSGGCLESDLAEHARRVHETGRAEVVRYDTRDDDDAPWGLGLGCNGLIDVLLEPLSPAAAKAVAALLNQALGADTPSVVATVIKSTADPDLPAIGAHALFTGSAIEVLGDKTGEWGNASTLANVAANAQEALTGGRRGLVHEYGSTAVAFEVVMPAVRLVLCGSGPDALPIAHFGSRLGWDIVVVDHRPVTPERTARFPEARVVACAHARHLSDVVPLTPRTAAVVLSHNYTRDLDYVQALLGANVAYVGVLGPRARTERMLDDLAARSDASATTAVPDGDRLFGPVGLDIGGDGPEAIALAIIAEVSAVTSARPGGHLRDWNGPLHESPPIATSAPLR